MRESLGAGINQQQMAQIDSSLMGMGFNFYDPRFRPAEKSLEDIAKYNPAFNTQLAAQQIEKTARFGTKDELAKLTDNIKSLGEVAKSTNTTLEETQNQLLQYPNPHLSKL